MALPTTPTPTSLSSDSLLSGLPASAVQALEALGERRDFSAGELIVREGETSRDFWILLEGSAEVILRVDDDEDVVVSMLQAGDSFGELSVFLDTPRTATVRALDDCSAMCIAPDRVADVYAASPQLALNMSRRLAAQLRNALEIKNQLQLDARPPQERVEVKSMTELRSYARSYYTAAAKTLLRSHRLFVDQEFPVYETTLQMDPVEVGRWTELFEVGPEQLMPRFAFVSMVGTMLLTRVVSEAGVNFRHLLHLRHEDRFHSAERFIEPGVAYAVRVGLTDIVPLRDDRVALVVETRVADEAGAALQTLRDSFIILNLDPIYVEAARQHRRKDDVDIEAITNLGSRESVLASSATVRYRERISVPSDMGKRYGRTSGDMNMVHTTAMAAKLFGFRKPFIQGLCSASYVLRAIARAGATARTVDVRFARRIEVGSDIEVLLGDGELEVLGNDKVRVFGTWSAW